MAHRKSSKSSFNSLVKQPYFFAAIILIAVVAVVLMFSASSGQTAKFSVAKKVTGPGSGASIGACYSNADCSAGFHCEYTKGTKGTCVKTPPPCVDADKDGYGAEGTDLSGCVDSQRADCRDDVFSRHPGAKERCGNNIDEDCDGKDSVCPASEKCNGKDDDLDGSIDENWPNKGRQCTVGVGACQKRGIYVCSADGSTTNCNAVTGTPTKEICDNGIDEDCSGADLQCPQCTDTDGGEVYDKKGTCTFWNATSQKQESRTDSCGPSGYNYVKEYFCSNNACTSNYKNGACSDGAFA